MRRELVEVEEVDRIAARELMQDVLDDNFNRARVRSRFDNDIAAEAEEFSYFLVGSAFAKTGRSADIKLQGCNAPTLWTFLSPAM